MRVANRSAIAAKVDRIHHRERTTDAEDESEKKSDDGGKREVHNFDDVMPGLSPPVLWIVGMRRYPGDDEQGRENQGNEEECGEQFAHRYLFIGGTGKRLDRCGDLQGLPLQDAKSTFLPVELCAFAVKEPRFIHVC